MQLVITSSGAIHCVYSEAIELSELGSLTISRGSSVEPNAEGMWECDLAAVQGPRLGPFACRSAAIAAEIAWFDEYWLHSVS